MTQQNIKELAKQYLFLSIVGLQIVRIINKGIAQEVNTNPTVL